MTGASGVFSRSFDRATAQPVETTSDEADQRDRHSHGGLNSSPNVFELIELHKCWFGEEGSRNSSGATVNPIPAAPEPEHEREEEQEQEASVCDPSPAVYHIVEKDTVLDESFNEVSEEQAQTEYAGQEPIEETSASAESVLQQLPQHGLEAAPPAPPDSLARTMLSDLEAALAATDGRGKREAS